MTKRTRKSETPSEQLAPRVLPAATMKAQPAMSAPKPEADLALEVAPKQSELNLVRDPHLKMSVEEAPIIKPLVTKPATTMEPKPVIDPATLSKPASTPAMAARPPMASPEEHRMMASDYRVWAAQSSDPAEQKNYLAQARLHDSLVEGMGNPKTPGGTVITG